jgi:hypothetical protein
VLEVDEYDLFRVQLADVAAMSRLWRTAGGEVAMRGVDNEIILLPVISRTPRLAVLGIFRNAIQDYFQLVIKEKLMVGVVAEFNPILVARPRAVALSGPAWR